MPKKMSHASRSAPILLASIPILFVIGLFTTERSISDATADVLHVWLQFVTTNWPNWHGSFDRTSIWFALAVSVRVAVADSLIAGIWVTFAGLLAWNREHTMRYADALRLRDHAIELEMLKLLPDDGRGDTTARVHKAFEDASRSWEDEHLPTALGPDRAKEFIRRLHEQQIGR